MNSSLRIAQSLAIPTLVQFGQRRYSQALLLLISLVLVISVYCWSGFVFTRSGFYGLLAIVALWWGVVAIDAARFDTSALNPPLSTIGLALYGTVILALLLSILAFKHVLLGFEVFRIPSSSMVPTLAPGHFVIVDTRPSFIKRLALGDIVVFRQSQQFFIKRWVGRGGFSVETEGRELRTEGYARTYDAPFADRQWRVPKGRYFMVGDNQKFSKDSRRFGAIEEAQLVGQYRFTLNSDESD